MFFAEFYQGIAALSKTRYKATVRSAEKVSEAQALWKRFAPGKESLDQDEFYELFRGHSFVGSAIFKIGEKKLTKSAGSSTKLLTSTNLSSLLETNVVDKFKNVMGSHIKVLGFCENYCFQSLE